MAIHFTNPFLWHNWHRNFCESYGIYYIFMAIDVYWGSGSPYSWRVLLALEYKRLPWNSHLLEFSRQEHKSPQLLALNFRGRLPVIKDGDYVVFESLAVLFYLDRQYPQ